MTLVAERWAVRRSAMSGSGFSYSNVILYRGCNPSQRPRANGRCGQAAGGKAPMGYFFDLELPMARRRKNEVRRIVLAACVIAIGRLVMVHAAAGALPRAGGPVDTAACPSGRSGPHVNAGASPQLGE